MTIEQRLMLLEALVGLGWGAIIAIVFALRSEIRARLRDAVRRPRKWSAP